jgi:tRNA pseudouridine55 synthase
MSGISALLLVDKDSGWTSHDVVAVARGALDIKKIGHSGSLDPMATGLMILLIGGAAKLQSDYQGLDKTYRAELQLGVETDTWDAEGKIVKKLPVPEITEKDVLKAAGELIGRITQPIPFYSAKKVNGTAMYKAARKGVNIEKESGADIYEWSGVALRGKEIDFTVKCGCGTYVRSLAMLLGKRLGTTAHLTKLRRLSIGKYGVEDALSVAKLKTAHGEELQKWLKIL